MSPLSTTFCDMNIIFMQITGNQLLIFIWQAFIGGMSHKGLILVDKICPILVWNVQGKLYRRKHLKLGLERTHNTYREQKSISIIFIPVGNLWSSKYIAQFPFMLLGSSDYVRSRKGKQIIVSEKSPHWTNRYKIVCNVIKEDRSVRKQE